jgi:heme/copper-type cytochrome/quinol oxidase subunit 2
MVITANDVIHAWMVPAFGVKQDAIPGFVRDTWFRAEKVGTYRGSCAELCGKDHAFMPIVVEVKSRGLHGSGSTSKKKEMLAPRPTTRTRSGPVADLTSAARRSTRQLRRLPPADRQGVPARSRHSRAPRSCWAASRT